LTKLDDNDNNHNNRNHVVKHNNFDQYYDACNNIPANSMCPVMLNYLPTYCLVFGAILLAGCGSVTA